MTSELPFPHHNYQAHSSEGSFEFIRSGQACPERNLALVDLDGIGAALRQSQVAEIVLIHGTFAGNDIIGLVREVTRYSPRFARTMKSFGKRVFDQLAGETGNYTQEFANQFSQFINSGCDDPIPVRRLNWSGENHHLGRAGGAIAMLDQLFSADLEPQQRVLIWGHSHGGNLMAMLSLLLGASTTAKRAFFKATRPHYHDPFLGRTDLPQWKKVSELLLDDQACARLPQLDVVTFGSPLRYRWNTDAIGDLLHFVQHRPQNAGSPESAKIPDSMQDVLDAVGGDYVQQFGIGGTDFLHSFLAWRSWTSERRLRRIFEPDIRRRDLAKNLRQCRRVSCDGTALLVDYPDTAEAWNRKLVGHGIYTRSEWLPFHLRIVARRFYGYA